MDIWIKECTRQATCQFCGKPIPKHTPMIVGKMWPKRQPEQPEHSSHRRIFAKMMYWHTCNDEGIHCWEMQGIMAMKSRPKKVSKRSRPRLEITPEDRKLRYQILNRRSTICQRIRNELERTDDIPTDFARIARYGEHLEELRIQIEPLGGVPKNWSHGEK